jgi:hypothetical protein
MNDYISKPVVPKALAEVLNKWLPEKDEEITPSTEKCGTQSGKKSKNAKTNNSFINNHSPQSAAPLSLRTYHSEPTFDRVAMMEQMMDDEDLAKRKMNWYVRCRQRAPHLRDDVAGVRTPFLG